MAKSENSYDVIVVGGGAAGLMAAGVAASRGKRVLILEKNEELGKKLAITGGGRCNIMNMEEDRAALLSNFGDAAPALQSAFAQFGVNETVLFFEQLGLPLKVEDRKRAFPKSNRAIDVVLAMQEYIQTGLVEVRTDSPVERVNMNNGKIVSVQTQGYAHTAGSYIFATGGVSHPETGSTGDGFRYLSELGHTVASPTPTIVPLKTKDAWVRKLSGTTLSDAKITFYVNGERRISKKGNILLTHFGLSGPTILNTAGKVADLLQEGQVTATIDMFPSKDMGILDAEIVALFDANKNKQVVNMLSSLVPSGMVDSVLAMVPGLALDTRVHSVSKEHRRLLSHTLKGLPVTISGLMGLDRAVVADGGVPLSEIDTRTMRSRVISNLFIVGDLLHVNRPTGGYSLQLCWTTGYVAGINA